MREKEIEKLHTINIAPTEIKQPDPDLFTEVLNKGGISVEIEGEKPVNITLLDFKSIPKGVSTEQVLAKIAKDYFYIENINDVSKENLVRLNNCFLRSKDFMMGYLHQNLPDAIKNLEKFDLKDLKYFIDRTRISNKKSGLASFYCAMLSVMMAEWECQKQEFKSLHNESGYLYKQFFEHQVKDNANGNQVNFHRIQLKADQWDKVGIYIPESENETDKSIIADMSYRGKDLDKLMLKMLTRPEVDVEKIITDGIGIKIETSEQNIPALLSFLVDYLQGELKMTNVILEPLSSREDLREHTSDFAKRGVVVNYIPLNVASGKFKSDVFKGKIKVPKNGVAGNKIIERSIEIQIVPVNNQNETGLNHHDIYDAKQKLVAYDRLFGYIPVEYLDFICQEAEQLSKIKWGKIKDHIIEDTSQTKALLEIIPGSKNKKYGVIKQHERWKQAGLID